jgi:hypothetical protein
MVQLIPQALPDGVRSGNNDPAQSSPSAATSRSGASSNRCGGWDSYTPGWWRCLTLRAHRRSLKVEGLRVANVSWQPACFCRDASVYGELVLREAFRDEVWWKQGAGIHLTSHTYTGVRLATQDYHSPVFVDLPGALFCQILTDCCSIRMLVSSAWMSQIDFPSARPSCCSLTPVARVQT